MIEVPRVGKANTSVLLCTRQLELSFENDCAGAGTMPVGLRQFGGAVLDGKVYLVGGLDNHPENHPTDAIPTWRAFLCFDPATGEWQHNVVSYNGSADDLHRPGLGEPTLPRNPTTPTAAYVCAHKGKVWVISGNPIGQNGALLLPSSPLANHRLPIIDLFAC